jgi:glycosyltransferase involved in cell wall biosynthesis
VLHVAQPTDAGVAVAVVDYVRLLGQRGWDSVVACPPGRDLGPAARAAGAEVQVWQATREPGPVVLREARALRAVVDAVRPSVVHLHSSKAGMAGRLRPLSTPVVFTPHAWSWQAGSRLTGPAALRWERWAARYRTDAVMCGSEAERHTGAANGVRPPSWTVVPNTVAVEDLPNVDQAAARAALGLPEGSPLAACVARLSHQKGQDVLLDAWPAVAVPDATLVLVGDGPDRDALEARLPRGARIVRPTGRQDALTWMAAADVVVAPSRYEGLSLSVLEALAMGRVVIASDVEGMREAMAGTAGTVVAPEQPAELAATLTSWLQAPDVALRAGLAHRAQVRARLQHQRSDNADAMVTLYASLLDRAQ